ncbi:MAG: S9 family peptidase [Gemmatimonadetes bacterium]|nr:S9 family peptidase [Gemmatimonadota bacterium]
MNLRTILAGMLLSLLGAAMSRAQAPRHAMSVTEFLTLDRVSEPAISPDGKQVVYTVITTDLAANRRRQDLWLVSAVGGEPRRISTDSLGGRSAKWSPDGKTIAFVNSRGGTPQVWLYPVSGGPARKLTTLSTGADGVIWSPTGTMLAFVSEVYPDCPDDACNARRAEEDAKRPSKARGYDDLLYRHWNTWEDDLRSHLFVVPAVGGPPTDLLKGKDYDTPVPPFGGSQDYAFSPDGRELAFTAKVASGTEQAHQTNSDIFTVPVTGGEPVNLTANLKGGDQTPAYSADGKSLAFLSQERPGFESDRWRLMVRDRQSGATHEVPQGYDQSIGEYLWAPGGPDFFAVAEERQRHEILHITAGGDVHHILRADSMNPGQIAVGMNGQMPVLAFVADDAENPGNVYTWIAGHEPPRAVTRMNAERLRTLALQPAEEIKWRGAEGDTVYGLLVKPPRFQPGRRYPLVVLVHGGPQGAWLDNFHSRWNAGLFAAPGYVVFMPNPRGSTGFGQKFVDQISRDWGGRVYTDIMNGVDTVARLPYVDSTRMAAAGGSYGGYMMNWMEGHTTRFRTLVNHAGVYNLESMSGATEELWFPEWEFGGVPWANRQDYERWSPQRFAAQFRTPMLVINGEQDFRVPYTEGLQAFTALRRQGIAARLLVFPDEGHWISRPQNQLKWWTEVQGWLARYLNPALTP